MRRLIPALALAAPLFLFVWTAVPAWGDEGGIEVTQVGAVSQYPGGISLFISAGSPGIIDEIRVFLRKTGRVSAGAYRRVQFEASNSGDSVEGQVFLASGGGNYMPPGTEITYFFEIRDRAGAVHRTLEKKVVYTDARFDWQSLSDGALTVYYYGEGGAERAQLALEAALATLERMSAVLGLEPAEPIRIVSYRWYSEMLGAIPPIFQALQGHIQTEGMAFGDERVVLIRGFNPDVERITSHEITHLLVAEATGRAHTRMPAWLGEGLAEYGNTDSSREYDLALRRGIIGQEVEPLWTLDVLGGDGDDILRAYGQAKSVVEYLASNYGVDKIADLIRAIPSTLDIDQALEIVYGFGQYELDSGWRVSLGMEPLPRPVERRLLPTATPTAALTLVPTNTPPPSPTPPLASTLQPTPTALRPQTLPTDQPTSIVPVDHNAGEEAGLGPSSGCSSPRAQSGPLSGDLALLASLMAPMAMSLARSRRYR